MLIGLNGKAGTGKDTVADYLVEEYGFKRYAFADAVRDVALAIDPWVFTTKRLSQCIEEDGWDFSKRNYSEVRRLLQVIGTEAGRQVMGENVWVDILAEKWFADGRPDAVVTDLRFPNEFEWVNEIIDEVTVHINRPNNPNAIPETHVSEQYSPDCRYTLINDGPIEALYAGIEAVLHEEGELRG